MFAMTFTERVQPRHGAFVRTLRNQNHLRSDRTKAEPKRRKKAATRAAWTPSQSAAMPPTIVMAPASSPTIVPGNRAS